MKGPGEWAEINALQEEKMQLEYWADTWDNLVWEKHLDMSRETWVESRFCSGHLVCVGLALLSWPQLHYFFLCNLNKAFNSLVSSNKVPFMCVIYY